MHLFSSPNTVRWSFYAMKQRRQSTYFQNHWESIRRIWLSYRPQNLWAQRQRSSVEQWLTSEAWAEPHKENTSIDCSAKINVSGNFHKHYVAYFFVLFVVFLTLQVVLSFNIPVSKCHAPILRTFWLNNKSNWYSKRWNVLLNLSAEARARTCDIMHSIGLIKHEPSSSRRRKVP